MVVSCQRNNAQRLAAHSPGRPTDCHECCDNNTSSHRNIGASTYNSKTSYALAAVAHNAMRAMHAEQLHSTHHAVTVPLLLLLPAHLAHVVPPRSCIGSRLLVAAAHAAGALIQQARHLGHLGAPCAR